MHRDRERQRLEPLLARLHHRGAQQGAADALAAMQRLHGHRELGRLLVDEAVAGLVLGELAVPHGADRHAVELGDHAAVAAAGPSPRGSGEGPARRAPRRSARGGQSGFQRAASNSIVFRNSASSRRRRTDVHVGRLPVCSRLRATVPQRGLSPKPRVAGPRARLWPVSSRYGTLVSSTRSSNRNSRFTNKRRLVVQGQLPPLRHDVLRDHDVHDRVGPLGVAAHLLEHRDRQVAERRLDDVERHALDDVEPVLADRERGLGVEIEVDRPGHRGVERARVVHRAHRDVVHRREEHEGHGALRDQRLASGPRRATPPRARRGTSVTTTLGMRSMLAFSRTRSRLRTR